MTRPSRCMPHGLAELLVRDGLWTADQAGGYVEACDPREWPGALAQLVEVLPAEDRERLLRLALRDIPAIAEPEHRLTALSVLARLPATLVGDAELEVVLALAREAAAGMPAGRRSLALLRAAGQHLAEPGLVSQALDAARTTTVASDMVFAAAAHLEPAQRMAAMDRIWSDAGTLTDAEYRADTYQILAMWLDDQRRVVAQDRWLAAVAAVDGDQRGWTLAGLANHLVPEQNAEALRIAGTVTDDCLRALVLSELARYMAPADRQPLLRDAVQAVTRCASTYILGCST